MALAVVLFLKIARRLETDGTARGEKSARAVLHARARSETARGFFPPGAAAFCAAAGKAHVPHARQSAASERLGFAVQGTPGRNPDQGQSLQAAASRPSDHLVSCRRAIALYCTGFVPGWFSFKAKGGVGSGRV